MANPPISFQSTLLSVGTNLACERGRERVPDFGREVMPSELLYGELANFKVDIAELRKYYESTVLQSVGTDHVDGLSTYQGWALTSRDGSIADGVQANRKGPALTGAVTPTALCTGVMRDTLEKVESLGLSYFRARVFRLDHGYPMEFHIDVKHEAWRLHIPIFTAETSVFQWELVNGEIVSVHLPADGRAWLVRVDQLHRAVNTKEGAGDRVHVILSIERGCTERRHFGANRYVLPPELRLGPGRRDPHAPPSPEQMGSAKSPAWFNSIRQVSNWAVTSMRHKLGQG